MDNNVKPSTIMLIAGGAVLFISTFLDWTDGGSVNGWNTDFWGFQGWFVGIIGLLIGAGVAAKEFGNVSMPDNILTLNHDQLHMALGFSAFLITFGFQLSGDTGIGILLGWIASAVIVAASIMNLNAAGGDGPPTQF